VVEGDFVAAEIDEVVFGESEEFRGVGDGVTGGGSGAIPWRLQETCFEDGDAAETPDGFGDLVNEDGFHEAARVEFDEEAGFEGIEVVGGFARDDDERGTEAVFEGVCGGAAFAGVGAGAGGMSGVAAVGNSTFSGGHDEILSVGGLTGGKRFALHLQTSLKVAPWITAVGSDLLFSSH
jgi:hypothetical protein